MWRKGFLLWFHSSNPIWKGQISDCTTLLRLRDLTGTIIHQKKRKKIHPNFSSSVERQKEVFNMSYLLGLIARAVGVERTMKIEKGKQFLYCWASKWMTDWLYDISFRDTLQSCLLLFDFFFFKEKMWDMKQIYGLNKGKYHYKRF